MRLFVLLFGLLANHSFAATDFRHAPEGAILATTISHLRPSQFAVGFFEVQKHEDEISELHKNQVEKFLAEHFIPVVVSPSGDLFMTDHHHLARALWNLRREIHSEKVYVLIVKNWAFENPNRFWSMMSANNYVYLLDEEGRGPLSPELLPEHVRLLKDDPYRSLAYMVRRAHGFLKTNEYFAEFRWAEFFRTRIKVSNEPNEFKKTVKLAVKLAHSPEAKHLPGWTPEK